MINFLCLVLYKEQLIMEFFGSEEHRIILGDSIKVLEGEIHNESIDLIFVDPPYNIGKDFNGYKDKWNTEEDYLNWYGHPLCTVLFYQFPHQYKILFL